MFYAAALVYALIFWGIGYRNPKVLLLLIFALAPFQNDVSGGGPLRFSMSEINLMLSVPIFVLKRRRMTLGPLNVSMVLYLLVCLICSLFSWRATTLVSYIQTCLYYVFAVAIFAHLVRDTDDYRPALRGLIFVAIFLGIAGIVSRSSYYLGLHKNGVGASLASAVVVSLELFFSARNGKWKTFYAGSLCLIGAALIFTLSRGAWLSAICGVAVIFALRRQFKVMLQAALIMIPLVAIVWTQLPEENRHYATNFNRDAYNIGARYESVYLARDLWESSPLTGVGVGLRKEYDATNLFWLTLAETGPLGVLTLFLVHFMFLRMVWKTERHCSRSTTTYSVLAIGSALVVGRLAHGMVDHYWSRGAMMLAWAGAGMALRAHLVVRRELLFARHNALYAEAEADDNHPEIQRA